MRVHNVEVLVARENAHVHVADRVGELRDDQHEQMPVSMQRLDTRRIFNRDHDSLRERKPQLVIDRRPREEVRKGLPIVVAGSRNQRHPPPTAISPRACRIMSMWMIPSSSYGSEIEENPKPR